MKCLRKIQNKLDVLMFIFWIVIASFATLVDSMTYDPVKSFVVNFCSFGIALGIAFGFKIFMDAIAPINCYCLNCKGNSI